MNGRGRLQVKLHSVAPGNFRTAILAPAEARAYLELIVQDDGPGISDDVRSRVFEPFFTTKNVGALRGTGLGLSTLYMIAQKEGYGIDLESTVGRGTTFRIVFPLLETASAGRESPSDSSGGIV
jgi:signal transduction histidine kinase